MSPKTIQTWSKCRCLTLNYQILNFLETATLFLLSSLKSPFVKKTWEKKKTNGASFPVDLLSSFTKNNQRKPAHCGEEIIRQGRTVYRLESTKELLEEEVVCTTSLKHEELNKWSHDQDKSEVEIQQTGSQRAASYQGNSYSLADDILNNSFETMRSSPDSFSQSLSQAKGVCPDIVTTFIFFSKTLQSWIPFFVFKHFSGTPDLFSYPSCSPSRQEINS